MRPVLLVSLLVFAACSVLRQEIDHPGGMPEYQANRLLPAFSRGDRADRYLIALALLSQLAAETASDGLQAASVASEINRADRQITELVSAANVDAGARQFIFESMSYEVQASLYALSKSIAMNAELEVSLRKLAELDVIWLARQLRSLRQNVPAARRSAALYRDVTYILADALAARCRSNPGAFQADCRRLDIVNRSRDHARSEAEEASGPLHDARSAVRRMMLSTEFDMALQPQHRVALQHHIARACWRLYQIQTIDGGGDSARSCRGVDSAPTLPDS